MSSSSNSSGDFSRSLEVPSGDTVRSYKPANSNLMSRIEHYTSSQISKCMVSSVPKRSLDDPGPRPSFWKQLFRCDELSDTTLTSSDGIVFPVNRLVLATASPYFRTLFSTPLDKNTEPRLEVESTFLRSLLEFAYTGECPGMTSASVQILLPIADKYQFQDLTDHCCRFIKSELEPSNCLGVYRFTRQYYCPEFNKEFRAYILRNFEQVVKCRTEFLTLSPELLKELLEDEFLSLESEEMVYEALCMWLEFKMEERFPHFLNLLPSIRFGLMKYDYFQNVVCKSEYCKESKEVAEYLCNTINSIISPAAKPLDEFHIQRRPRIPSSFIFAIGGWSALNPMTFVEHYDIMADRWMSTSVSDITPRAYHGVIFLNGLVFVFGGNDGYDNLSTMFAFDPVSGLWSEKACMHEKRCYVSSACLDNRIYAMGGHNAFQRTNTAEMYNPERNQWQIIAAMHDVRSDASACVFNNRIYIAGGFTGQDVLDTVEFYVPHPVNQWTRIMSMTSPRCGLSLVTHGCSIYAIGGRTGPTSLRTGERLNTFDIWEPIPVMPITRSNHGVAVIHGVIYVIGGYINGDEGLTNRVDVFNPDTEIWTTPNSLMLNRSGFTACVVKDIPNPETYSYVNRLLRSRGLGNASKPKIQQIPEKETRVLLCDEID